MKRDTQWNQHIWALLLLASFAGGWFRYRNLLGILLPLNSVHHHFDTCDGGAGLIRQEKRLSPCREVVLVKRCWIFRRLRISLFLLLFLLFVNIFMVEVQKELSLVYAAGHLLVLYELLWQFERDDVQLDSTEVENKVKLNYCSPSYFGLIIVFVDAPTVVRALLFVLWKIIVSFIIKRSFGGVLILDLFDVLNEGQRFLLWLLLLVFALIGVDANVWGLWGVRKQAICRQFALLYGWVTENLVKLLVQEFSVAHLDLRHQRVLVFLLLLFRWVLLQLFVFMAVELAGFV